MLNTYETFGLTGPEALRLIDIGDGYLQQKIDEIKGLIPVLIEIIKVEVSDETQRRNIFGKLAMFIKTKALLNSQSLNNSEVDSDFRA
jgi:hypothetical protein